jgi:hypothetical protein
VSLLNTPGGFFAGTGFSFDPNISPNNQTFAAAVRAVMAAGGYIIPSTGLPSGALGNPTNKVALTATNGVSTQAMRADGAPALDQTISPTWTGTHTWSAAAQFINVVTVNSGTTTTFQISGTGSVVIQGWGTAAGTLVDMTPDSQTWTATLSGVTTTVTGQAKVRRTGNVAVFFCASLLGSSTSTLMTVSGLPAAWQPTASQNVPCVFEDGGNNVAGYANITNSGVITFQKAFVSGTNVLMGGPFTASGQKGMNATTFEYALT